MDNINEILNNKGVPKTFIVEWAEDWFNIKQDKRTPKRLRKYLMLMLVQYEIKKTKHEKRKTKR